MSEGKLQRRQYAMMGAAMLALALATRLPYSQEIVAKASVCSAWLCERFMNGLGCAAVERTGPLLQSVDPNHPFRLDFQDGGWTLKQFLLLLPVSMFLNAFRGPIWKLFSSGLFALLVYLPFRVLVIGSVAMVWGEKMAAGPLDTVVRCGCILSIMLVMLAVSPKNETCREGAGTR